MSSDHIAGLRDCSELIGAAFERPELIAEFTELEVGEFETRVRALDMFGKMVISETIEPVAPAASIVAYIAVLLATDRAAAIERARCMLKAGATKRAIAKSVCAL